MIYSNDRFKKVCALVGLAVGALLIAGSPAPADSSAPADPALPAEKIWSQDKRFVDNGDGTITDTRAGLMWTKKDSYLHTGHWITWTESSAYIKKLNEGGFANHYDWQMPTLEELITLYEPHKTNSQQVGSEMKIHIDPIFAKEGSGAWWSLETNGHFNAFGVEFNNGKRFSAPKKSKARKAVRPMRVVKP